MVSVTITFDEASGKFSVESDGTKKEFTAVDAALQEARSLLVDTEQEDFEAGFKGVMGDVGAV